MSATPPFQWEYYAELNPDLEWLGIIRPQDLAAHWRSFAVAEKRQWRFVDLFPDFVHDIYRSEYKEMEHATDEELEFHYFRVGRHEGRRSTFEEVYPGFTWQHYRNCNPDLELSMNLQTQKEYERHWLRLGRFQNRSYTIPPLADPAPNKHRVAFFLVGFGQPNIEAKIQILKKNLEVFERNKGDCIIDLYIYMYSTECKEIIMDVPFKKYVYQANVKLGRGIVAEFIYRNVVKVANKYDYVALIMDDIQLPSDLRIKNLIKVYELEQLDILALPLTPQSPHMHQFSLQNLPLLNSGQNFRETNFAELFFYFMNANGFRKYHEMLDPNTKWAWGIDMCLHNAGIRTGILDSYPVHHYFKGASYSRDLPDPRVEQQYNMKRFQPVKSFGILRTDSYAM